MLKAIYAGDLNHKQAPVFSFKNDTGMFVAGDIMYHFDLVMNDSDFIVFATDGETVYPIKNLNVLPDDIMLKLISDKDGSRK